MGKSAFKRIHEMLEASDTEAPVFPPTIIYNEGWMLRIILSLQFDGVGCLPFTVRPSSRWYSEALLASPFLPRKRGDPLAESHTHVDGVIGHIDFRPETKAGLTLTPSATQFVVTEAKMFSHLSKGTTHAPYYDQAARNVGCIAWVISQSGRSVEDFESLGFYVLAPQEQIDAGVFSEQVQKSSIREKVSRRVSAYSKDTEKYDELQTWMKTFFLPTLQQIDIRCLSWESTIDAIDDASIRTFYNRCLKFNAKPQS